MLRISVSRAVRSLADPWFRVTRNTRTVRSLAHLMKALGWTRTPILEGEHLGWCNHDVDLNDRRLRDAEVVGAACANMDPAIALEIGTAHGHMTAIMARNAPKAIVHTVNIPPEEIKEGGKRVSFAPSREETGEYYKALDFTNIKQIFANTARWEPDFGPIDVAFIDGCHDADFVFNDTRKVLRRCRSGSIILWHDFNPDLIYTHDWIGEVCGGIDRLYARKLIRGRILRLEDSWVGLYRVP